MNTELTMSNFCSIKAALPFYLILFAGTFIVFQFKLVGCIFYIIYFIILWINTYSIVFKYDSNTNIISINRKNCFLLKKTMELELNEISIRDKKEYNGVISKMRVIRIMDINEKITYFKINKSDGCFKDFVKFCNGLKGIRDKKMISTNPIKF